MYGKFVGAMDQCTAVGAAHPLQKWLFPLYFNGSSNPQGQDRWGGGMSEPLSMSPQQRGALFYKLVEMQKEKKSAVYGFMKEHFSYMIVGTALEVVNKLVGTQVQGHTWNLKSD